MPAVTAGMCTGITGGVAIVPGAGAGGSGGVPGGGDRRGVTWCARPDPLLNAASPELLTAAVLGAHEAAGVVWPALAGRASYESAVALLRASTVTLRCGLACRDCPVCLCTCDDPCDLGCHEISEGEDVGSAQVQVGRGASDEVAAAERGDLD